MKIGFNSILQFERGKAVSKFHLTATHWECAMMCVHIRVILYFTDFLPNHGRIPPALTYNGSQGLNIYAGIILPGFGRKFGNIGKLEYEQQLQLFKSPHIANATGQSPPYSPHKIKWGYIEFLEARFFICTFTLHCHIFPNRLFYYQTNFRSCFRAYVPRALPAMSQFNLWSTI